MTPTLMKYLCGEKAVPAQHPALPLTNNHFVRPNATDEPHILNKSTPELRKFLAVLIYTGFKKREAELFLKLSVDAAARKLGIEPVVDIRLFDYKLERDSERTKPRAVYEVGIENNGRGKIICLSRRHCTELLRSCPLVSVALSAAHRTETTGNDVLRVSLTLSARRKRRKRVVVDWRDAKMDATAEAEMTIQLSVGKVAKKLELALFNTGPAYLLKETAEGLPLRWCTNLDAGIRQTTIDQLPPAVTREGGFTLSMTQDCREVLINARDVRIALDCGPALTTHLLFGAIRRLHSNDSIELKSATILESGVKVWVLYHVRDCSLYTASKGGEGAERKSFSRDGGDNYGTLGDESEGDGRYHGSSRSDISRDSVGASCALTQGSLGSSCTCDGCNSGSDAMCAATYGGSIDEGCNDYGCSRSGVGVICVAPKSSTTLQICHRGVDESGDVMYIVPREPTGSTCNASCGEGEPSGTMSAVASGKSTDSGRGNEGGEGAMRTVTSDGPQGPDKSSYLVCIRSARVSTAASDYTVCLPCLLFPRLSCSG